MGVVTFEELQVDFALYCEYSDSSTFLYPFGVLDEQVVCCKDPIIVQS
jgi:hypothetical protein